MSSVVETLEAKLLVPFENLAKRLRNQFPNVSANAYSRPSGSPEYNGQIICVDCVVGDALSESDNVALVIDLMHLNTQPKIIAYVCWGHPSGYVEAELSPEWLEVSDDVLKNLYADLSRLSESLVEAVRRRKPRGE